MVAFFTDTIVLNVQMKNHHRVVGRLRWLNNCTTTFTIRKIQIFDIFLQEGLIGERSKFYLFRNKWKLFFHIRLKNNLAIQFYFTVHITWIGLIARLDILGNLQAMAHGIFNLISDLNQRIPSRINMLRYRSYWLKTN